MGNPANIDYSNPIGVLKQDVEEFCSAPDQSTVYDAIIIGVGSVGSAACYHLGKAGHKVLGIEQFGLSHEQGSHSGQTRIYRKAYFEHPDYVPLLERSYKNWEALEQEAEVKLLNRCGLAYIGPKDGELVSGVQRSSELYSIPVEDDKSDNSVRFDQFSVPNDSEFLFEANAGFVHPERAILTYCGMALKH